MTIGVELKLEQVWGQRLRKRRKDLRFSQKQLADAIEPKVHQTTISKIESGERVPNDALKIKLTRVLGYGDRVHLLFPWPGQEDVA